MILRKQLYQIRRSVLRLDIQYPLAETVSVAELVVLKRQLRSAQQRGGIHSLGIFGRGGIRKLIFRFGGAFRGQNLSNSAQKIVHKIGLCHIKGLQMRKFLGEMGGRHIPV